MRKGQLLALGLLCGILLPLTTNAKIEDGIYTVEGGHKTAVFSGTMITVASGDLEGWYFWGRNEPSYDNSGNLIPGKEWETNPTNGVEHNDDWGGGDDNENNGGNSGPNPNRQGPCKSGWHVPSLGEIDKIEWKDRELLNFNTYDIYGISSVCLDSPICNQWDHTRSFWFYNTSMYVDYFNFRGKWDEQTIASTEPNDDPYNRYKVRCFKDVPITPQSYTVSFFSSTQLVTSGEIVDGGLRNEDIPSATKEGYDFDYRYVEGAEDTGFNFSGTAITDNISLYAKLTPVEYEIDYKLDEGTNSPNNVTGYTIESSITLENATKDGYNFDGWFLDTGFTTQITEITQWSTGNIILYAKWTKIETKPSGGSSSGGGGSSASKSDSKQTDKNDTGEKIPPVSPLTEGGLEQPNGQNDASLIKGGAEGNEAEGFSEEFQQAYEFAHEKGITTMPTINDANMNGKLTRIAMAKMLSYYAINVLGMKPDETRINKFNDITEKLDAQYDSGVTLAYQLGIMGINMPDNKFRPNDEVTRAEFATALSRMLYNTSDSEYKSTPKYYIHHMEKLLKEGIITKNDPAMKELRGYVMIMLMRSSKK